MTENLPTDITTANSCFFTGHRFLAEEEMEPLYERVLRCILDRNREGVRYFLCGGAIGFDLFAAQAVIMLRRDFGKDVHLVLVLPCRDQTARWSGIQGGIDYLRQYHEAKSAAEGVVYIRDFYVDGCMRERNQYMVDHSSRCIAFWNGTIQGGTAQTIRMAQRKNLPIWNLHIGHTAGM